MIEFSLTTNTESITPRLAAALDQLSEGVIIANETGEIIFVNAAASTGIGSSLIKGFVRQLKAEMSTDTGDGRYTVTVTFEL